MATPTLVQTWKQLELQVLIARHCPTNKFSEWTK